MREVVNARIPTTGSAMQCKVRGALHDGLEYDCSGIQGGMHERRDRCSIGHGSRGVGSQYQEPEAFLAGVE